MEFGSYNLWLISIIGATVALLAAAGAFVFYTYLISRMPDAVWFKNLKQRVLELEAKLAEKTNELKEAVVQQQQVEKATRDAVDAMERAAQEKQLAEEWLQDNSENIAKIPKWKEAIAELKEKGDEAKAKLLEIQQQRIDEQQKVDELQYRLDQLNKESLDVQNRKKELEATISDLENKIAELQAKTAEVRAVFAEQQTQLDHLRSKLAELQKEIKDATSLLKTTNMEMRTAKNDLQEALARREGVEREIIEKEKLSKNLQDMLGKLGGRIDDFSNAIKPPALMERLEDFHRPILELPGNFSSHTGSEAEILQHFFNQVEAAGYIFHERTLHAFHTSLKISDISPLVVLAGISGTGKSQLPRLYAQYMGMHFMNVAIQPRWDAPEDLFGFYNYMEHRYKATELARGLRQMDSHYHPDKAGSNPGLQSGMLLVLLDEMNLARVEYYFSELLSKLEMRNRNRVGDEEMHALSAIQIQAGSLSEEDGVINKPLFVGYNVLFVGTMNEDETTQALSDKVIDRSNVLRFGRPGKTQSEVLNELSDGNSSMILHRTWEGWIKNSLEPIHAENLNGLCHKLNEALENVGRPFGHRIHQAIYQYIANYPDWVDGWFEKAFADQLEQKILPKLRGLSSDTDDHLEEVLAVIGSIIGELNDPELADAFNSARERPVFDFKGVNRGA